MITLTVNGKERQIDGPTNLVSFLEANKIEPRLIAIEYNGEIIKREEWAKTTIGAGDKLEIVHMVAG
ncbi:MAG: sulfur carrier protein ThiS, partial [Dehalococcoidia bacterium]